MWYSVITDKDRAETGIGCGLMNERERLIRFVLDHPELIDWLEETALWIEKQTPDRQNN